MRLTKEVRIPNPHLKRVPYAELNPYMQSAHDANVKVHGEADRVEIYGNAPHVFDFYRKDFYERLFYAGQVDVPTKELLRLRLAGVHGCTHCDRGDRLAAAKAGIALDKIDSIMKPDAPCFDERERAIIDLADQLALPNMHGELTTDLYGRLSKYYSDGDIYELGVVGAVLTGMAKMLFVYDLVERESNCPIVQLNNAAE